MRKARGYWLLVMVGLALICGCTPVQLTPAEKVDLERIVERSEAVAAAFSGAAEKVDAAREVITELVAKHDDVLQKIDAVAQAIKEKRVPVEEGAALVAKLKLIRDELATAKVEVKGIWEGAQADADACVTNAKALEDQTRAFEERVTARVKDETGSEPNAFWVVLGTIVALATGGGGLKLVASLKTAWATIRKLRAGFKVTAGTLADLNPDATDGKATDEAKAKIRARLALTTELDEVELEILRREALEG